MALVRKHRVARCAAKKALEEKDSCGSQSPQNGNQMDSLNVAQSSNDEATNNAPITSWQSSASDPNDQPVS